MNAAVNDLKSITMNCLLVDNCFIYNIITKIFEILTFLNIRTCSEMCSTEYMTLCSCGLCLIFPMDAFVLIDSDRHIGSFTQVMIL